MSTLTIGLIILGAIAVVGLIWVNTSKDFKDSPGSQPSEKKHAHD